MRLVQLVTAQVAAVMAMAGLAAPATAETLPGGSSPSRHIDVRRDHPDVRVPVVVSRTGEAVIDLNAAAPGTDWAVAGAESAVVSISIDGHYATDLVVSGEQSLHRQLALGHLSAGPHVLRMHFSDEGSPTAATSALVNSLQVTTYAPDSPEYLVLRYAPVVYGRNLADLGSPYQNATTDTPLIAWHEVAPAATPGHQGAGRGQGSGPRARCSPGRVASDGPAVIGRSFDVRMRDDCAENEARIRCREDRHAPRQRR